MSNCEICNGTGWQITDRGAIRCVCVKQNRRIETGTPLAPASISVAVKALQALAFFPVERAAQTVIGDALAGMCPSVEALRYVVRRACSTYKTWDKCGIAGLRQIVCARFVPADGIESGPTECFPEGLPSETKHDPLALPAGVASKRLDGPVSADAQMDQGVKALAAAKQLPPAVRVADPVKRAKERAFAELLRDTITAPSEREEPKAPPAPVDHPMTFHDVEVELERRAVERFAKGVRE